MSTKIKSYPNPVFGNGDDYCVGIDDNVLSFHEIEKDKYNFYCSVTLNLDDAVIMNLIKEKKAVFLCEIDCIKTNYRTCQYSSNNKLVLEIPREKVVDNVDINFYIIAIKTIDNYTHPDFNEIFADVSFSLEAGDIIATLGSYYFNATIKYSKCPAPSSLMQVQRASSDSNIKEIKFNTDEERIFIIMPNDLFDIYTTVCGQNVAADDLFVSTIAVDALAYALMTLRDSDSKLAINLKNILRSKNIEINEEQPECYLNVARKLLEDDGVDPYTTFMKKLKAIISKKGSENDSTE